MSAARFQSHWFGGFLQESFQVNVMENSVTICRVRVHGYRSRSRTFAERIPARRRVSPLLRPFSHNPSVCSCDAALQANSLNRGGKCTKGCVPRTATHCHITEGNVCFLPRSFLRGRVGGTTNGHERWGWGGVNHEWTRMDTNECECR